MVKTEDDAEAAPQHPRSTGAAVPTIGTCRMIQIVTNRTAMLSIKWTIGKRATTGGMFTWYLAHFLRFRMSDEDEESNSLESDLIPGFGNLQVDDKNANCGAQGKYSI